ncbi:MAG: hypothetical protein KJO41_08355 [Bacteroidia bacterium]|nr:hypothetical protein [Bacteroidia bacterium]NND26472.1 hypothetical protein [Flavobacteriaceae bacterium]MBT8278999.1 hypothetical protein [Bacteroidia bacterium]NNK59983.1 hypothetical protein [Flavobacteriaceae bacterium]NNL33024.1 hypothetical protein [Flavobacteriaceae bacterium]
MNTSDFIHILKQPQELDSAQFSDVRSVISEFPYFQPARAIYLKGLKNQESFKYNQELKTTAAFTTDRSVLFDFITSSEFEQNSISEKIKKNLENLKDIEIYDIEDVSISTSVSLNKAITEHFKANEPLVEAFNSDIDFEKVQKTEVPSIQIEKTPEEKLELGKPLEFDSSEMHSFSEWLKITSFKPIIREASSAKADTAETRAEKTKKSDLIDRFIETNPKIKPVREDQQITDFTSNRNYAPESLMTETLARIYLEQKNYEKAIQAYKILSLKYPEKSGFFADQIQTIKEIQNK